MAKLLLGDYESGLALYESRLEKGALHTAPCRRACKTFASCALARGTGAAAICSFGPMRDWATRLMMMRYPDDEDFGFRKCRLVLSAAPMA